MTDDNSKDDHKDKEPNSKEPNSNEPNSKEPSSKDAESSRPTWGRLSPNMNRIGRPPKESIFNPNRPRTVKFENVVITEAQQMLYRDIDKTRRINCKRYHECASRIAILQWGGWTCNACPAEVSTTRKERLDEAIKVVAVNNNWLRVGK